MKKRLKIIYIVRSESLITEMNVCMSKLLRLAFRRHQGGGAFNHNFEMKKKRLKIIHIVRIGSLMTEMNVCRFRTAVFGFQVPLRGRNH